MELRLQEAPLAASETESEPSKRVGPLISGCLGLNVLTVVMVCAEASDS